MGLIERAMRQHSVSENIDMIQYENSPEGKRRAKFFEICKRLEENVDLQEISCDTYEDVLNEVEKRKINISDIVSKQEYPSFKKQILTDPVQCCPHIGRAPEKIYDLDNPDDFREWEKMMFRERKG